MPLRVKLAAVIAVISSISQQSFKEHRGAFEAFLGSETLSGKGYTVYWPKGNGAQ